MGDLVYLISTEVFGLEAVMFTQKERAIEHAERLSQFAAYRGHGVNVHEVYEAAILDAAPKTVYTVAHV